MSRYYQLSASALSASTSSIYAPQTNNNKASESITSNTTGLFSSALFDEEIDPTFPATASIMKASPNDARFDTDNSLDDKESTSSMSASTMPGAWGPSGIFNGQRFGSTHNSNRSALYDRLLPDYEPEDYMANPYLDPESRSYSDPTFGAIFLISFIALIVTGTTLLFTTNGVTVNEIVSGSVYNTIYRSSGLLMFLTILAVGVGVSWIWIMKKFVRPIVYMTVIVIPASCLSIFAVIFINSIMGKVQDNPILSQQYSASIVWSLVTLAIGASSGYFLMKKRLQIDQTIYIIELACDVLQSNPTMLIYSLALASGFITFSLIWLVYFSRLWIINPENSSTSTYGSNYSSMSIFFFIFMYLWTSSVVQNVQKTMIAGVVADWWYNPQGRRRVIHYLNASQVLGADRTASTAEHSHVRKALKVALTTCFGSIALASLVMAIVTTIQTIIKFIRKQTRDMDRAASQWLAYTDSIVTMLTALTENLNSYALVYCALTGSHFCEAAKKCTRLFRRNLVLGLVTNTVTRLILGLGVGAIALGTSAWAFFYASRGVGSPYAWIVAMLGGIIPYFIVSFLSDIVQNTVDACFVYYLMDLDNDSCHCESAHKIFATAIK